MIEPIRWNRQMVQCLSLLTHNGVRVGQEHEKQLKRFLELIREWNAVASLVSQRDLERLEDIHLPDSLSLAPVVKSITKSHDKILDIGTGGGFPGVPLAVLFPERRFTWVERSMKKIGFLRKVHGALGLQHVVIRHGEFPGCVAEEDFQAITARAVETPEKILKEVGPFIVKGAVFLNQAGPVTNEEQTTFHVEHIEDGWHASGLRRGTLELIRSSS